MISILKIFKNISIFSIASFLPQVSNFILLPITTNYLTNTDFSIYGTILAYNMLVQGMKSLGLDILFINSFFKDKSNWKKSWSKYLGIRFIWKHIFLIVQFFVLYFFLGLDDLITNKLVVVLLIALPDYFFSVSNDTAGRYYISDKKANFYFIVTIISVLCSSLSNYYFIVFKDYGYMGWLISSFIFAFVSFIFNFFMLYIKLRIFPCFNFDLKFLLKTLKISLPMIPHNYSSFLLHSSDRIVLDKLNVGSENIGNYNIAYMIINILDRFGDAFGFVISPIVNELYAKKNRNAETQARNVLFASQIFFILIAISFALLSKEIFLLVFNDIYNEEISLIATIMVMGMTIRPMYWATVNKLIFYEKTNMVWRISTFSGLLNLFLNLVFIPYFGYFTSVITTNVCLLFSGFLGFFLTDYKKLQVVKYYEYVWLIIIIALTVLVSIVQSFILEIRLTILLLFIIFSTSLAYRFRSFIKI